MPEPIRLALLRRLATGAFVLAALALALWWDRGDSETRGRATERSAGSSAAIGEVESAYRDRLSAVMVEVEGDVDRALPDDAEGSRHQRFVVRLGSGHTVLVAHNIDLAPRVPLKVGDRIALRGQYEWNERGGVVHWTHHDPEARRPGGWIRHRGREYR